MKNRFLRRDDQGLRTKLSWCLKKMYRKKTVHNNSQNWNDVLTLRYN